VKIVALLPMKGHSERVPNKNMRDFAGKPLYHHVASTLEKSDYVEKIVINTDSDAIAQDAQKHFSKAVIVERKEELCGDFVSMNKVIEQDVEHFSDHEHFLQTHSTNPLVTLASLNAAIEKYFSLDLQYDSLYSVNEHQGRFYDKQGEPINHKRGELLRTQDLPAIYEENSNFYIFSRKSFRANSNSRIGLNPHFVVMNKLESADIDYEEDFILAELIFKNRSSLIKS
jgi:CMP-N-acetylneuraminic acid synthetase